MRRQLIVLVAIIVAATASHVWAADPASDLEQPTAPVTIDGRTLFHVRGVSSYPPAARAAAIAERIKGLAADRSFDPSSARVVDSEDSTDLMAGPTRIMAVLNADAALENIDRRTLAGVYLQRVQAAVEDYRDARRPDVLRADALRAVIATLVFFGALWLVLWTTRRVRALLESRYRQRLRSVAIQSFQILEAQQIWSSLQAALNVLRLAAIALLTYFYLYFVLDLFPWTQPTARALLSHIITPLERMGQSVLGYLPDLIFLILLVIVARYVLRVVQLFFEATRRGTVAWEGFDPDWSQPSYRLVRLGVIVLTAVIAYPYIPGSGSEAFKGISIFLGVMFSIGSSSFISNIIAGYALIYRRAFKVGDRVQIDDVIGDVVQTRLQVTHLRSLKGEEVIVPNSLILNSKVVNFSSLAGKQGLILHTTVGIGYEIAWRKVEAMLLQAAERTAGLLREPKAFVLQKALGDFAITYELNVYCGDAQMMAVLYTALHRNILDVFNEHGVQIMTPAYEGDPAEPKIVPKEQWFSPPATPTATEPPATPTVAA